MNKVLKWLPAYFKPNNLCTKSLLVDPKTPSLRMARLRFLDFLVKM